MTGTELIRDFVNTRDLLDGIEELGSPGELVSWLESHGLTRGPVTATAGDLRRALELREALRRTLLANTGLDVDREAAFAVVDRTARRAKIELRFFECAGELSPAATGVDAALGRIVIAVHGAMADGSWERLKACRASDCEWAFIDGARNHSRAWCSMRSCGNREKARAFRERARTAEAPGR
jgi:predicted RNA-binding Zn ribbon-like protein